MLVLISLCRWFILNVLIIRHGLILIGCVHHVFVGGVPRYEELVLGHEAMGTHLGTWRLQEGRSCGRVLLAHLELVGAIYRHSW